MNWTSVIAIYALAWTFCAFVLLPVGIRTHDEEGVAKIKGQADSAPANFRPGRVAIRATILSAIVTGIFVLNYTYGWVEMADFDIMSYAPAGEPEYR